MKLYRILAVAKKVFRDLKNDKRTVALIFIAPIFSMFVFGLAFSGNVKNVPVVVVNKDEGLGPVSVADEIISNLDKEVLNIEYLDNVKDARERVENGEAYAVIVFSENLTKELHGGMASPSENPTIKIMADKSNVNIADSIMKTLNGSIQKTIKSMGSLGIESEAVYGEGAEFIDFFVPGIMAFVVYLLTTLLTLISFVGERTSGTLDRLLSTPLRETEIVAGYAITFSLLGTMQAAFLLAIGILVFNITIIGNVVLAFAVVAVLAIACQSLGILLSSLADREAQAVQFLPFIILPAFLLSGIFWPLEAIPSWLRPASYLVPPTYAIDACRSVILRGWGLEKIWTDVAALFVFAAVFLTIAVISLKRRG
ncbi:MAG: ABC transporter permease [Euryarchaeota archaeon]|nr:ABC transporter permease [Euryarchaeota archaeon]